MTADTALHNWMRPRGKSRPLLETREKWRTQIHDSRDGLQFVAVMWPTRQVNIKAGMGGSQLEETAVHEDVHVEDRANFVNTITPTTYDRNLNITHAQSERNAFGVENEWLRLGNMPARNIDDILAHPPYSDNPDINKPLFPGLDGPH